MSVVVPLVVTTDLSFFMEREVLLTRKPLENKVFRVAIFKTWFFVFWFWGRCCPHKSKLVAHTYISSLSLKDGCRRCDERGLQFVQTTRDLKNHDHRGSRLEKLRQLARSFNSHERNSARRHLEIFEIRLGTNRKLIGWVSPVGDETVERKKSDV